MGQYRRCAVPPDQETGIWIKRLRASEEVQVVVLSDKMDGFISHWTGQVSIPCVDPSDECEGCASGFPARWRGYLHCLDLQSGKEYFLEVTKGAAEQLALQLECATGYRGMRIMIRRMSGDAARLKVQINAPWEKLTSKPLPPFVDPEASLQGLYRKNTQKQARSKS